MESWTETAQSHLTDWTAIHWTVAIAVFILAVAISLFPQSIFGVVEDWHWSLIIITSLVLGLGTLGVLAFAPGSMMRHIETQSNVSWIFFPCIAIAGILFLLGLDNYTKWLHWAPAAVLTFGVVFGAINDWLQRTASAFPTSVLGLLVLGGVVAAFAVSSAFSSPSRR